MMILTIVEGSSSSSSSHYLVGPSDKFTEQFL